MILSAINDIISVYQLTLNFLGILQQSYEHLNQHTHNLIILMLVLHSTVSILLANVAFQTPHHDHSIRHSATNKVILVAEILGTHSFNMKTLNFLNFPY